MSDYILSPNEAAEIANTSRSAIMRAVYKKTLFAEQNNERRWIITRENLDKWMADRPKPRTTPERQPERDRTTTAEIAASIEVAGLKAENSQLKERLDEMRTERSKLIDAIAQITKPKASVWSRIFGSTG